MDAEQIVPLTAESVAELVEGHRMVTRAQAALGVRRAPRWPFPGATQVWLTDETGAERMIFATCCNLSTQGLGVRTDEALPVGAVLPLAIHLPQASYHGKAMVRHCTAKGSGYFVGMEFSFEQV